MCAMYFDRRDTSTDSDSSCMKQDGTKRGLRALSVSREGEVNNSHGPAENAHGGVVFSVVYAHEEMRSLLVSLVAETIGNSRFYSAPLKHRYESAKISSHVQQQLNITKPAGAERGLATPHLLLLCLG